MQMKTFRAATSTAAFEKIKAELGDDAVILSNKTISDNGSKCCEIVAAIDTAPVAPKRQSKEAIVEDALENTVGWQREWSQIKGQIMALMKPQIDLNALSPKQRIAMEYLEREDADETVMTRIFCDLREDKNKSILPVLESLINVKAFNTHNWSGTFHAFAGPGGAGKTSSLVRLALKEKKKIPKHAYVSPQLTVVAEKAALSLSTTPNSPPCFQRNYHARRLLPSSKRSRSIRHGPH